jgi:hypothetical protein
LPLLISELRSHRLFILRVGIGGGTPVTQTSLRKSIDGDFLIGNHGVVDMTLPPVSCRPVRYLITKRIKAGAWRWGHWTKVSSIPSYRSVGFHCGQMNSDFKRTRLSVYRSAHSGLKQANWPEH